MKKSLFGADVQRTFGGRSKNRQQEAVVIFAIVYHLKKSDLNF